MPSRSALPDLAQVPLFSACSKKDLQHIGRQVEQVEVPAGRELVREGAAGSQFFVILDGSAEVSRRGQRVATLGPGAFFGDLALLDHAPRNATVTATSPMTLAVLGQREFSSMIDELPGFAHKLLKGLAHRLREYDARSVQ